MVNDILLGQYIPTGSLIHGASPKMKILSLAVFTMSVFFVKSWYLYFYLMAVCWFVLKLSRLGMRFLLNGLRPLIFIFIITLVLNVLFNDGDRVIWEWGMIKVTWEGLDMAFRFFMRVTLLVLFATLLTLTTSPIELSDGIEECMRPLARLRFPVHEFSLMMTIALRFIPTLVLEVEKIRRAQEARGANFSDGNIFKRAASFVPILIPLFVMSFKRADELAVAMESRCYSGGEGRTKFGRRRDGISDYFVFAVALAAVFPVLVDFLRSFR